MLHSVNARSAGGQDHRHRRPLGQRQVHAGRPGAAHLRRHCGRGARRWRRRARLQPARPARERGAGEPGRAAVQRLDPQQHRVRRRQAGSRKAVEAAAKAAYVDEFANELPQGLDTPVGDRGALAVGRPAPAHRHRARAAQGCADPDPRRGDVGARQRIRAAHPAGAGRAHAQPHHAGHRASPVHHRARRRNHRHGRRPHRRARHACRAGGARTAPTPVCKRAEFRN